jgi:hypothetical protein
VWLTQARTQITREHAVLIRGGMTRSEVEAILGGPARIETGGWIQSDPTDETQFQPWYRPIEDGLWTLVDCHDCEQDGGTYVHTRYSDEVVIIVTFDPADRDRVVNCMIQPLRPSSETITAVIRRWFRL